MEEELLDEKTSNFMETENEPKKKIRWWHKLLIGFVLIIISIFVYSRYIETKLIQIEEKQIVKTTLPSSFNGLKIVHFSDIHYGLTVNEKELKQIVEDINELNADIIFFTGDLFTSSINYIDQTIAFLKEQFANIKCTQKKYAVIGDQDMHMFHKYKEILEGSNFILLENENDIFFYKDVSPIMIAGVESQAYNPKLSDALTSEEPVSLKILLSHEPSIVNQIEDDQLELIFAGHSLGGQIKIPGVKPIISKDYVSDYYTGQFDVNNTSLFVTNGLGTEKYPFRFGARPTINLYRIYNYY